MITGGAPTWLHGLHCQRGRLYLLQQARVERLITPFLTFWCVLWPLWQQGESSNISTFSTQLPSCAVVTKENDIQFQWRSTFWLVMRRETARLTNVKERMGARFFFLQRSKTHFPETLLLIVYEDECERERLRFYVAAFRWNWLNMLVLETCDREQFRQDSIGAWLFYFIQGLFDFPFNIFSFAVFHRCKLGFGWLGHVCGKVHHKHNFNPWDVLLT